MRFSLRTYFPNVAGQPQIRIIRTEEIEILTREDLSHLDQEKLPIDNPRPPVQSFQGSHHSHTLSPELTKELNILNFC